ncbi:MAG: NADPH-dependent F420 reductase [Anaerolineaceae bacterium]|nr:NADPH-dependent F420 reductase [Anaerolineaceae bacterium]
MVESNGIRSIAILGGTGKEGKGLAYRWAKAGYRVLIGSRKEEKAEAAAEDLKVLLSNPDASVQGLANPYAAAAADIVVITVPYKAHRPTLESLKDVLQGKILVDVTVPLVPPKVTKVQMPPSGSACQEAQEILGEGVKVVAAFQSISYENLLEDGDANCDILVTGNGRASREVVLTLVADAGLVGWDAGPIENSAVVEGMTSILIGINKKYGVTSSGIRITGVPRPE